MPPVSRTMGHDAATDNIETLKVFIVIQQNVRVTRHKDDQCLTNDWGGTHDGAHHHYTFYTHKKDIRKNTM